MDFKEFQEGALITESVVSDIQVDTRVLHAVTGMVTESVEMLDHLKKVMFYGKPLDAVNLREECGDLLWYYAILLDALEFSHEDVMRINNEKLKSRYGDKFDANKALNRDLDAERVILEDK